MKYYVFAILFLFSALYGGDTRTIYDEAMERAIRDSEQSMKRFKETLEADRIEAQEREYNKLTPTEKKYLQFKQDERDKELQREMDAKNSTWGKIKDSFK